jgi:large subunit ribosomal protein L29
MKAKQYRQMSKEELEDQLEELQKKLFELRSQAVTETLENNKIIRNTKHDVARIKTILRERVSG